MTPINDASTRSAPALTRSRVVVAAVGLIDREGLTALTMRRLGHVLGVEGMALYHYVTGRDDLLDGVVAVMTADAMAVSVAADSRDWRDYLFRLSAELRRALRLHPRAFPLLATRPLAARWWLRAPLLDSDWHQHFVQTLSRCGFTGSEASSSYRLFTSFLAGQLLLDSASLNAHPLADDPKSAARRSMESQTDFDSAFDVMIHQLAQLRVCESSIVGGGQPDSIGGTAIHGLTL